MTRRIRKTFARYERRTEISSLVSASAKRKNGGQARYFIDILFDHSAVYPLYSNPALQAMTRSVPTCLASWNIPRSSTPFSL